MQTTTGILGFKAVVTPHQFDGFCASARSEMPTEKQKCPILPKKAKFMESFALTMSFYCHFALTHEQIVGLNDFFVKKFGFGVISHIVQYSKI